MKSNPEFAILPHELIRVCHTGPDMNKLRLNTPTCKVGNWLATLAIAVLLIGLAPMAVLAGNVEATLVAERDAAVPGETLWIAMRQDIRDGWHTYWRNPGDSGRATEIKWQDLPAGLAVGEIEWPWPERIAYGPLMNYGYHGTVLLPVPVYIPASLASDSITLKAKGEWLVCADVCIPEDDDLSLTLPVRGTSQPSSHAGEFAAARRNMPTPLGIPVRARTDDKQIVLAMEVPGLDSERVESVSYLPYAEALIDNPAPQIWKIEDERLELTVTQGWDFVPDANLDGLLLIEETAGEVLQVGFEVRPGWGQTAPALRASDSMAAAGISVWLALGFALLGGAILNLMPCVFPVLSIKILSLVSQSAEDHTQLAAHGWTYAAGVVISFVVIATVLLGLRFGGLQIGWGFHLQSPVLVCLLMYLLFLVGLNLIGMFEIGTSVMGIGSRFAETGGYCGSFATGVLATLVAAPCTAPFMGAAVGFALTQPSGTALAVFAALGFGMALPYLALCNAPGLLARLPRPGLWMTRFRELLSFPMFASTAWLLWVLSLQAGSTGVLVAGAGMVLIAFGIWLLRLAASSPLVKTVRTGSGLAALLGAVLLTVGLQGTSGVPSTPQGQAAGGALAYSGPVAAAWSPEALSTARESGPVFVNFTAAWCITCKVNEAVVLNKVETRDAFIATGITYLQGDWTKEDPRITEALATHGRGGVPLYLYYPGGAREPEVLPQVLTLGIVLDAVGANSAALAAVE